MKSSETLNIGRDHMDMSLPHRLLIVFSSLGCLYRYIMAFPMPEVFNISCDRGGNDSNHLVTASLIFTAGRDRSGIGANQSVRAESTLASKKPSIRFVLLIWLMARSNIADFLVAGCRLALSCRSSSAASRIFRTIMAMCSSLSLIMSTLFFLLLCLPASSFFLANMASKSLTNSSSWFLS